MRDIKMNKYFPTGKSIHSQIKHRKRNLRNCKAICDNCKIISRTRHMHFVKGEYWCYNCYQKTKGCRINMGTFTIQQKAESILRKLQDIDDNKIRKVRGPYGYRSQYSINVPSCYKNKFVRIIVMGEFKCHET